MDAIKIAHFAALASNLFMLGVICFVRVVHYPLFLEFSTNRWKTFHQFHVRRTGLIVTAPMFIQLISTLTLLLILPDIGLRAGLAASMLLSLGVTGFISMRLHGELAKNFDSKIVQQLLAWDRLRILGWAGGSLLLLARALQ